MAELAGTNRYPLRGVGWLLFALPFVIFALLVSIWPLEAVSNTDGYTGKVKILLSDKELPAEAALFAVVFLAGAMGSTIFAARSFAMHHARKSFDTSWLWWYFMRIPVGIGIALVLYIVLRGGLFAGSFANPQQVTQNVNPFGFAAIAALGGMFARQASEKLEEIFENMLKTDDPNDEQDVPSGGADEYPKPEISTLAGGPFNVGGDKVTLIIKGKNFRDDSKVQVDDNDNKPVKFASAIELRVVLTKDDLKSPKSKLAIAVVNPEDAGGSSDPKELKLKP